MGRGLPETPALALFPSAAAPMQQLNPPPAPWPPCFCISIIQSQLHCRFAPNLPCLGHLGMRLSLHYLPSSLRHLCLPQPVSCQTLTPEQTKWLLLGHPLRWGQAGAEDNMDATGAVGKQPWAKRRDGTVLQPVLVEEEVLPLCRLWRGLKMDEEKNILSQEGWEWPLMKGHLVPWGATRDCGLKEDEERLYVLKLHISGALSNPNLLPVWGRKIPLGGPPHEHHEGGWHCPLASAGLAAWAGAAGAMALQGLYPGIMWWRTSSSTEGKHVPSIKAARQRTHALDKFKNTSILLKDAGPCGNVSFTGKQMRFRLLCQLSFN